MLTYFRMGSEKRNNLNDNTNDGPGLFIINFILLYLNNKK